LVNRRVTIADLGVVFALLPIIIDYCDNGFRKQYSNVFRWFETVVNQPSFVEVMGQIAYCNKNPLPPVPKKQAPAKQQKKKEKKRRRKRR